MLRSGIPQGQRAYALIAVCIAFSIVAHSGTDVPVARMFDVEDLAGIPEDAPMPRHAGPVAGDAPQDEPGSLPATRTKEAGHARI